MSHTAIHHSHTAPRGPFFWLYGIILSMLVAMLVANIWLNSGRHFPFEILDLHLDLRLEGNFAVWYSSAQLLLGAIAAAAIGILVPPRSARWLHTLGWFGVAALMLAISIDETCQFHEWAGQRYGDYVGQTDAVSQELGLSGLFRWLLALSPLIILGTVWLIMTATHLLRSHPISAWLCVAGLFFWVVVISQEYVEDLLFGDVINAHRGQQATLEEGSEIIGSALLLIAFLEFLRTQLHWPHAKLGCDHPEIKA